MNDLWRHDIWKLVTPKTEVPVASQSTDIVEFGFAKYLKEPVDASKSGQEG
jgi:hypothetical protein